MVRAVVMIKLSRPTFAEERYQWNKGLFYIAGADEVGRGCFAGPIVAAAVIFPKCEIECGERKACIRCCLSEFQEINDSKLLNPQTRSRLAQFIKKQALFYHISEVSVSYINSYGVGKANHLVLRKSISKFAKKPDYVLVDGFHIPGIPKAKQKKLVKGDRKSISIASASILAKVYRDQLMQKLHNKYDKYGFYDNKGYGTGFHRQAIFKYGLSDLHRTSFKLQKFLPR